MERIGMRDREDLHLPDYGGSKVIYYTSISHAVTFPDKATQDEAETRIFIFKPELKKAEDGNFYFFLQILLRTTALRTSSAAGRLYDVASLVIVPDPASSEGFFIRDNVAGSMGRRQDGRKELKRFLARNSAVDLNKLINVMQQIVTEFFKCLSDLQSEIRSRIVGLKGFEGISLKDYFRNYEFNGRYYDDDKPDEDMDEAAGDVLKGGL